jgi:ornithine cyclodeaminase
MIWGRDPAKAAAAAAGFASEPYAVAPVASLPAAVAEANVIVCATSSRVPLVLGEWLRPGQHLALLGSFQSGMCETDDAALARARVFADTRAGVLAEAGEVLGAIERGRFRAEDLAGDLADLVTCRVRGRADPDQITLFKSVGTAIADLAGAELALRPVTGERT